MGGWGGGEVATRYVERKKRKRWQPGTEALCSLRQGRSRRRLVPRYVKRKERERGKREAATPASRTLGETRRCFFFLLFALSNSATPLFLSVLLLRASSSSF